MSRSTRALVATGAAVALLAGSGATFARWYDEKTLSESRVATGTNEEIGRASCRERV